MNGAAFALANWPQITITHPTRSDVGFAEAVLGLTLGIRVAGQMTTPLNVAGGDMLFRLDDAGVLPWGTLRRAAVMIRVVRVLC